MKPTLRKQTFFLHYLKIVLVILRSFSLARFIFKSMYLKSQLKTELIPTTNLEK